MKYITDNSENQRQKLMDIGIIHATLDKWGMLFKTKRNGEKLRFNGEICDGNIEGIQCGADMDVMKFDLHFKKKLELERPKQDIKSPFISVLFGSPSTDTVVEKRIEDGKEVEYEYAYENLGVFCTNSNENLSYGYGADLPIRLVNVRVTEDFFNYYIQQDEVLSNLMNLEGSFFVYEELDPAMQLVFQRIFDIKSEELFYKDKIKSLGLMLLNIFFSNVAKRENITETNKYPFNVEPVFKAQTILKSTLDRPVTIDELTREVGLSESRLRYLFKQIFGTTIHNYHQDVRLLRSKEFLLEGKKTMLMIAMDLGFSSASHFSTAFKRKFKISPKEFQNNSKN